MCGELLNSTKTKIIDISPNEKMLNITHYQRNANQNHYEVPFLTSQNGCNPKVYK